MSELRDYQRMFVDNVANDIDDIFLELIGMNHDIMLEEIKLKLESRIESYDRERNEQIERDLPKVIARAWRDIC